MLPGDYNRDGTVDAADYVMWRSALGTTNLAADGNKNGAVDAGDYQIWRGNFGNQSTVIAAGPSASAGAPEPAAAVLLALGAMLYTFAVRARALQRANA